MTEQDGRGQVFVGFKHGSFLWYGLQYNPLTRGTGEGVKSCSTRVARGKDFLISFYTGKKGFVRPHL